MRYYQELGTTTVCGLRECAVDDEPAVCFDATGRRLKTGTWPSWFRDNPRFREILPHIAKEIMLSAAKARLEVAEQAFCALVKQQDIERIKAFQNVVEARTVARLIEARIP